MSWISVLFPDRKASLMRLIAVFLTCAATSLVRAQAAETVLYSFKGGADGAEPQSGLIFDTSGALYGTTLRGGALTVGTVYKLAPPAPGQTQWTHTVLYSFKGMKDGSYPRDGLIFDTRGALYGTTFWGGTSNSGTLFKLTPPAPGKAQWTHTVLYSFKGGSDGVNPRSGLIFDTSGALYGTMLGGGTSKTGTVFKLAPPSPGQTQWTESVLFSFPPGSAPPTGGNGNVIFRVVFGQKGALYGTIFDGVFKLTPPAPGQTQWTETLLHSFRTPSGKVVANPGLILDTNGAIYGTTSWGAAKVFKLTPRVFTQPGPENSAQSSR